MLKVAQKSIMLWDPDGPARKPPREAADLLVHVEAAFGLAPVLQNSADPDFLLLTIGETTRGAIERATDWLIPIISKVPAAITRLPSSASCFMLLRAYGGEGKDTSRLRELSAPLLQHVKDSLSGVNGKAEAVRALDLLMSDIATHSTERRRRARRVLEDALVESGAGDDRDWMKSILELEHAAYLVETSIKHMVSTLPPIVPLHGSHGCEDEIGSVRTRTWLARDDSCIE